MKAKKICICGHIAESAEAYDGQTIKTRNILEQLKKKCGEDKVILIDTYNWKKHPLRLYRQCLSAANQSSDIIIMPAHNGIKVFSFIFNRLKKNNKYSLHYIVIGGWIYSAVQKNRFLKEQLKKIDYIYIENKKIIKKMKNDGFENTYQMNNFKPYDKTNNMQKPISANADIIKCCILSRIEANKGIEDAIYAVNTINYDSKKILLDIYGKIDKKYYSNFINRIENNKYINYIGIKKQNEIENTLKMYDLFLFPTLYYTEGIPGSIIDALHAGLPVIASKWENYDEILKDGVTGFSYAFGKKDELVRLLKDVIKNKKILSKLSKNCILISKKYTPEKSIQVLFNNLHINNGKIS